jgi:hypothetical protein
MEITITEALRLKSDLSKIVNTLKNKIRYSSFGDNFEDDQKTSKDEDKFVDVETLLITSLSYSEELNNSLSDYNKDKQVDKLVRKMQNAKLLLEVYESSLSKTKATSQTTFVNLGTSRQSVVHKFVPTVTSKEIKTRISLTKDLVRQYQSKVEELNQGKLTLSFNYDNIEELN